MAKSLRASSKKANKTKLRSAVFSPVEDARTERLSAKLLELAAKPKEKIMKDAEVDEADESLTDKAVHDVDDTAADSKMAVDQPQKSTGKPKRRATAGRVQKKSAKKSIVFPVGRKEYRPRAQGKPGHRQKR